MSPIHRIDASFSKLNDSAFIIFGGATEYLEELLLNDLWIFDIGRIDFLGSLFFSQKKRNIKHILLRHLRY
jgi:hypothetical protein